MDNFTFMRGIKPNKDDVIGDYHWTNLNSISRFEYVDGNRSPYPKQYFFEEHHAPSLNHFLRRFSDNEIYVKKMYFIRPYGNITFESGTLVNTIYSVGDYINVETDRVIITAIVI